MTHDVEVKTIPAQQALVVRKTAKMSEISKALGEGFGTIVRHAQETGAQFAGPPFAMYPEAPSDSLTFFVAMPVAPGAKGGEGVEVQELPASEAATLVHKGPYSALPTSWQRLMGWVGEQGRQPGGTPREVYLSDPGEVAEEDLLTQLVVPLA